MGFVAGSAGWRWPQHALSWDGVAIGAVFAVAGWWTREIVPVRLWSGVATVVLSVLPLGALDAFGDVHPFSSNGSWSLLLAALMTMDGIASHVALDRLLASVQAEPETS